MLAILTIYQAKARRRVAKLQSLRAFISWSSEAWSEVRDEKRRLLLRLGFSQKDTGTSTNMT
jgi:hypothetical protein